MNNKALFHKKRFRHFEEDKLKWLRKLSLKDSIHIVENLLRSEFLYELWENFTEDKPVCLKLLLKGVRRDS